VVGELSYLEHFPGPLDPGALQSELAGRFGRPDDEQRHPDGSLAMTWHDGDRYLRVRAGNRVTPDREHMGVRSSVEVTLWTREFADYLADAERRCADLRARPMGELSVRDKQALVMNCRTP
jgi:hypothetical protein